MPLFNIEALWSLNAEVGSFRIDTFLEPMKPVLQIPYATSQNETPMRLSVVVDQMKDTRLPPYSSLFPLTLSSLVLLDCSIPALWSDITDRHLTSVLHSFSTLLTLVSLYQHTPPPPSPLLRVDTSLSPPSFYHIGYFRIHPVYMTVSVEATLFVSVSFQRTPFRLRVRPLVQCSGRVDDYVRQVVNGVIPSVLLQSPAFLGALDLIGNPANLIISVFNSVVRIMVSPVQAVGVLV